MADFYRYHWQVGLFFKWIKQHLRIKSFFGTSENAVKSQIWIAIPVYILVAIIKNRLDSKSDLYTILQILSLTLFENTLLALRSVAIFRAPRNGVRPISGANNGAPAIAFGGPRSSWRALCAAPGLPQ